MQASSQTAAPTPVPLQQRTAPTAVQAAAGVIAGAMQDGSATPREIAQAEEAAGLLFDPQRAEDIATAAREQARAEVAAELRQAREEAATAAYFKARYDRLQQLLLGRPDTHLMTVAEIHAAVDGRDPRAGIPLTLSWSHRAAGTSSRGMILDCTTAHGARAVLVVPVYERAELAALLHPTEAAAAPVDEDAAEALAEDAAPVLDDEDQADEDDQAAADDEAVRRSVDAQFPTVAAFLADDDQAAAVEGEAGQ
ncbi:hypothetical protein ACF08A_25800 [Streptomyces cellulosae]